MMRHTFLKSSRDLSVSSSFDPVSRIVLIQQSGVDHAMDAEGQETLAYLLPATELIDSQYSFCVHLSNIFKSASHVHQEVYFAQLAISVAPVDLDTSSLWYTVVKGLSDLSLYEDAYASLMSTPYEKLYGLSSSISILELKFMSLTGSVIVLVNLYTGCAKTMRSMR